MTEPVEPVTLIHYSLYDLDWNPVYDSHKSSIHIGEFVNQPETIASQWNAIATNGGRQWSGKAMPGGGGRVMLWPGFDDWVSVVLGREDFLVSASPVVAEDRLAGEGADE